ncbi:MAG: hypothetical protein IJQ62_06245 [Clostridia bacterium]|nr:hypothetical protein [Clostridia bacterium]
MVIAEIREERATVRIHDGYCRQEAGRAMAEAGRIVSQAYRRRLNGAAPALFESAAISWMNR